MGSVGPTPPDTRHLSDRLYAAVVVPLQADGETIDEPGYRKLLKYFIAAQEKQPDLALIANPEAGDIFYLSQEEQLKVANITVEEVGGRMPVFSGCASNSTKGAAEFSKKIMKTGVDGLFLAPPVGAMDITFGWDPENYPEIWGDYLGAISKASPGAPIICHPSGNVSHEYGIGLPKEATLYLLDRFPQIIGWKMTYNYSGNRIVSRAIKARSEYVALLPAMGAYFHEFLAAGNFDGTLTGSFNFALEPMLDHINAWRKGDVVKARKIWDSGLAELQEYIYSELGRIHIRYKTATYLRGLIETPWLRSPMPKPRKAEVLALFTLLSKMNVSVVDRSKVDDIVNVLER